MNVSGNDENCYRSDEAVNLDGVERVGEESPPRDLQDNCCAQKRKVFGNSSRAFKFVTDLINHEVLRDAGLSIQLIYISNGLAASQSATLSSNETVRRRNSQSLFFQGGKNEAQAELSSLQQNHDSLRAISQKA